MNVASLELCKELYELSGWVMPNYDPKYFQDNKNAFPPYDLGYLLRKLPHFIELSQLSGGYTPTGWCAMKHISQDYPGEVRVTADIPEDALCQLAIELIKQGIIGGEDE